LVCVDELKLLKDIERFIKSPIQKTQIEGFDPDPSIQPEPIQNGRGGGGGRNRNSRSRNQRR